VLPAQPSSSAMVVQDLTAMAIFHPRDSLNCHEGRRFPAGRLRGNVSQ
jgi:hypothetical protein